jgi:hypothetical protein
MNPLSTSSAYEGGYLSQEDDAMDPMLSAGEVRSVIRRQLIGSVVVAAAIAVFAGLTALRPAHVADNAASSHRFAVVQQPAFVTPAGERLAAWKEH